MLQTLYATSVAAQTLKIWQASILACFIEFIGAVALRSRVPSTLKSGIFGLKKFQPIPLTFMVSMGCAEVRSATFLIIATGYSSPRAVLRPLLVLLQVLVLRHRHVERGFSLVAFSPKLTLLKLSPYWSRPASLLLLFSPLNSVSSRGRIFSNRD
jgi:hypothetical protein